MSRVLVTRAADDAEALVVLLAEAGHQPVVAPMVAREPAPPPRQDPFAKVPEPDVLLLTSAAAAVALTDRLPPGFAPRRVCCVGPATAQAAADLGLDVDEVPEGRTGADAVRLLGDLRGQRVLWPRAEEATAATTRALIASGATFVDMVVYRTVAHPGAAALLAAAGPVDLVTLTAPSIARTYAAARAATPAHGTPPVVTIGPTTTAACEALGLEVLAEAVPPGLEGLVAALPR